MKGKYDNETKKNVILSGLPKRLKKIKKDNNYFATSDWIQLVVQRQSDSQLDCAFRINESEYRKQKKVRDKISDLVLNDNAYFLTLTFDDDTLAKTSVLTRRIYVARYLKQHCRKYVANIDFGSKKGREHYHAVVDSSFNDLEQATKKTFDCSTWQLGFGKAIKVRQANDNNLKALSKYITKLTNHALKNKGLQPRLIYSRD